MSANADPNPYGTISRVRQAIAALREAADEMDRQHPNDLVAGAQSSGARLTLDIIEATLDDNLEKLADERGVPKDEEDDE